MTNTSELFEIGDHRECGVTRCKGCPIIHGVFLGKFHKYPAWLIPPKGMQNNTILKVGCHNFRSRSEAARYWKDGENPRGIARPQAAKLIETAERAAKQFNWNW